MAQRRRRHHHPFSCFLNLHVPSFPLWRFKNQRRKTSRVSSGNKQDEMQNKTLSSIFHCIRLPYPILRMGKIIFFAY